MGIGRRIKEARNILGLTQEDLAKILGITKGAVANYENETSHPKESIMYKLFDALHVDANFLFQDEMGSNYPMKVSYEEMDLIKKFRTIDNTGKKHIEILFSWEIERINNIEQESAEESLSDLWSDCPATPEELEAMYPPIKKDNKKIG